MGTKSLVMMLPSVMLPPAPRPQKALATMNPSMLVARAHPSVATANTARAMRKSGFLPRASDKRPSRGWKAVDVSRKAVDSQDAELAAPK